jgi:hypothetical protein
LLKKKKKWLELLIFFLGMKNQNSKNALEIYFKSLHEIKGAFEIAIL